MLSSFPPSKAPLYPEFFSPTGFGRRTVFVFFSPTFARSGGRFSGAASFLIFFLLFVKTAAETMFFFSPTLPLFSAAALFFPAIASPLPSLWQVLAAAVTCLF